MNFEKDILIDEGALEVEWVNQPALAMSYGVELAKAFRTFQKAEERVKLVKAELTNMLLDDPSEYLEPDQKPTGPVIEAFYRNHERHKEAKEEWVQAQYDLKIAEIAQKEISTTRKAALQNLVTLHGQNYFAGPSMPRDISFEVKRKRNDTAETNVRIGKRMKRTTKKD